MADKYKEKMSTIDSVLSRMCDFCYFLFDEWKEYENQ